MHPVISVRRKKENISLKAQNTLKKNKKVSLHSEPSVREKRKKNTSPKAQNTQKKKENLPS